MNSLWDLFPFFIMGALIFRPGFLNGPLEKYEEAIHLSWAQGIMSGKAPYRDYYINYGPLYTFHFVLAYRLFGKTLRTHRLTLAIGAYASIVLAYLCGTLVIPSVGGRLLLAVLLPILSIDQKYLTCWGGFRFGSGLLTLYLFLTAMQHDSPFLFLASAAFCSITFFFSNDEALAILCGVIVLTALYLPAALSGSVSGSMISGILYFYSAILVLALFCFYMLKRLGVLRLYFHDAFLGILNMGKWRGGLSMWPKPFKGGPGLKQWCVDLFSEGTHYYAALITIILSAEVLFYIFLIRVKALNDPGVWILPLLFLFGLAHLASSIRVAAGPQFKTALPVFVVLWCHLITAPETPVTIKVLFIILASFLAASSGYFQFLYQHYRAYISEPLAMSHYSGVKMPAEIAGIMTELEMKVSSLTEPGEEILCLPYDASVTFFANRSFLGRHSIAMTAKLFDEDYWEMVKAAHAKRPFVVFQATPDLLPAMASHVYLKELYDMIDTDYQVVDVVKPSAIDDNYRGRICSIWPGSWFWFNANGLHNTYLLRIKDVVRGRNA